MKHFPTLQEYDVKFYGYIRIFYAVCKKTQKLVIPWECAVAYSVMKMVCQYLNKNSNAIP